MILDGNNIVGQSGWKFDALINLLGELRQSAYDYITFFDNNIYRSLKENDLISKNQSIRESLAKITGESDVNIMVMQKGEKADPYIIEHASRKNAAIVSNDNYKDFISEHPWLESDDRILSFKVVGTDIIVPKLNLLARR